jgi:hypothetical protein
MNLEQPFNSARISGYIGNITKNDFEKMKPTLEHWLTYDKTEEIFYEYDAKEQKINISVGSWDRDVMENIFNELQEKSINFEYPEDELPCGEVIIDCNHCDIGMEYRIYYEKEEKRFEMEAECFS